MVSFVWDHFSRLDSVTAICNKCNKQYKCGKGTTGLIEHLRLIHKIDKPKTPSEGHSDESQEISKEIANFFLQTKLPFSLAGSKPFKDLVRALNPAYSAFFDCENLLKIAGSNSSDCANDPLMIEGDSSDATANVVESKITNFDNSTIPEASTCSDGFVCHFCPKQFGRLSELNKHLQAHSGKTFDCHVCLSQFTSKYLLKEHSMIHDVNHRVRYQCDFCGGFFGRKSTLSIHMQKFHSDSVNLRRKHLCVECNVKFWTRFHLKCHMVMHTGEVGVNDFLDYLVI